MIIKIN